MPDTFAIPVIFIVVATGVAAFVRRIRRDKCLRFGASCGTTPRKQNTPPGTGYRAFITQRLNH